MASRGSQKLEDKLVCCICLEMFATPVTALCGHSFCEKCINSHWDKEEQGPASRNGYTCPECRKSFSKRPQLSKTVQLDTIVDIVKLGELPTPEPEKVAAVCEKRCPRHGRALELYCKTEKQLICCVCALKACQNHQKVLFDEERKIKEENLKETLEKTEKMEKEINEEIQKLEKQAVGIKELLVLPTPGSLEVPPLEFDLACSVDSITKFFSTVSRIFQEALSNSFNPVAADAQSSLESKAVRVRAAQCLPETELRMHLLKDHRNLTFDPATANKYLQVSEQNRKAKHAPGSRSTLSSRDPQKFEPWQILCAQQFTQGSNYWEVKLSGQSVVIGIAYEKIPRKKRAGCTFTIGLDKLSWGLHVQEDCYVAYHNSESKKIKESLCKFIGVKLDYDQGVLSFYGIEDHMKHLHSFHTIFTEPLCPIFWLCEGTAVTLCQKSRGQSIADGMFPDSQAVSDAVEQP
ncbi:E3 ubiquitin-protein ligase TRIM65 isoform X2 [Heteronotia binoei]|uniref:E3 ubiquitin-protein ligase TRIM65 isoform X2 n=1 Tax=Heteronotia binoei TaxID=13085 RepID=UPI00292F2CA3|nr:E3 ubiquitin-protein ligase TRIM65 isoform X2 [Heteronotia binoei]